MIKLRSDDVVWRTVEGEIVVLDMRSSRYLSLKGSGAMLWPLLAEGASREELVRALLAAYDLSEEQAQRDLEAFLADLRERSLLHA